MRILWLLLMITATAGAMKMEEMEEAPLIENIYEGPVVSDVVRIALKKIKIFNNAYIARYKPYSPLWRNKEDRLTAFCSIPQCGVKFFDLDYYTESDHNLGCGILSGGCLYLAELVGLATMEAGGIFCCLGATNIATIIACSIGACVTATGCCCAVSNFAASYLCDKYAYNLIVNNNLDRPIRHQDPLRRVGLKSDEYVSLAKLFTYLDEHQDKWLDGDYNDEVYNSFKTQRERKKVDKILYGDTMFHRLPKEITDRIKGNAQTNYTQRNLARTVLSTLIVAAQEKRTEHLIISYTRQADGTKELIGGRFELKKEDVEDIAIPESLTHHFFEQYATGRPPGYTILLPENTEVTFEKREFELHEE